MAHFPQNFLLVLDDELLQFCRVSWERAENYAELCSRSSSQGCLSTQL